ncbi:FLOT2 [Bugula neritina]|uniref:FLOT2 n=1 Tax=Bugula neritina TaxID=10212 RepID=A0A7J7J6Y1_BUGNE|nr:FLOT2 [Bugula neritina]
MFFLYLVGRREKELVATVRKAAEAEGYKLERIAEGQRFQKIAEATGQAEGIKLIGESEGSRIANVGKAEAENLRLKAEAFKRYGNSAIASIIVNKLPLIAAEIAQPLSKIDEIVILGDDRVSSEVTKLISNLPPSVQALTGKNISQLISEVSSGSVNAPHW